MSNFKDYIELANEMINEGKTPQTPKEKKIKKYTKSGHETLDKQAKKENEIEFNFSLSKHFSPKNENEIFIDSNKAINTTNKNDAEVKIKKFLIEKKLLKDENITIKDYKTKQDRITKPDYVYKIIFEKN